ncbi:hypothetical protein R4036_004588 [Salmonella enterica]|nr:hypothetical protein [Salmonella enterica]
MDSVVSKLMKKHENTRLKPKDFKIADSMRDFFESHLTATEKNAKRKFNNAMLDIQKDSSIGEKQRKDEINKAEIEYLATLETVYCYRLALDIGTQRIEHAKRFHLDSKDD